MREKAQKYLSRDWSIITLHQYIEQSGVQRDALLVAVKSATGKLEYSREKINELSLFKNDPATCIRLFMLVAFNPKNVANESPEYMNDVMRARCEMMEIFHNNALLIQPEIMWKIFRTLLQDSRLELSNYPIQFMVYLKSYKQQFGTLITETNPPKQIPSKSCATFFAIGKCPKPNCKFEEICPYCILPHWSGECPKVQANFARAALMAMYNDHAAKGMDGSKPFNHYKTKTVPARGAAGGRGARRRGGVTCWTCGKQGHKSTNCWQNPNGGGRGGHGGGRGGRGGGRGGRGGWHQ